MPGRCEQLRMHELLERQEETACGAGHMCLSSYYALENGTCVWFEYNKVPGPCPFAVPELQDVGTSLEVRQTPSRIAI